MKKLTLLAAISTLAVLAQPGMAQPPMEKYNKSCAVCHNTGAANAPKTHDVEAWKPRLDKGVDALVQSVNSGLNAMPPKGMCFDCSDDEYKALIEFMSSPAE
ncbi:c-type cytochrome [Parahaliea mediterranea]|uniref:Cytochrome c5 family protein n=1 Tax=Parahaliea mediterranea TaxID=651086 RepID=A0A939DFD1_9GAMM|nr:c-type cytochrome [Parahaliea mediterranea]MBN7797095.1 cytochrome c5 family protein [Parahaliea mediterranea]